MGKRGVLPAYIIWLLILVMFLAIIMAVIFVLKEKDISIVEGIKDLFRGRW
jgi:hypothetical protein